MRLRRCGELVVGRILVDSRMLVQRSRSLLGCLLATVLGCTGTVTVPAPAQRDMASSGGTTSNAGGTSGSSGTAAKSSGGTSGSSGTTNDPTPEACAKQTGAAL